MAYLFQVNQQVFYFGADSFIGDFVDKVRIAFAFGHGACHDLGDGLRLIASYHPSQQNTFTGRLTPASFDRVMREVKRHLERAA